MKKSYTLSRLGEQLSDYRHLSRNAICDRRFSLHGTSYHFIIPVQLIDSIEFFIQCDRTDEKSLKKKR